MRDCIDRGGQWGGNDGRSARGCCIRAHWLSDVLAAGDSRYSGCGAGYGGASDDDYDTTVATVGSAHRNDDHAEGGRRHMWSNNPPQT